MDFYQGQSVSPRQISNKLDGELDVNISTADVLSILESDDKFDNSDDSNRDLYSYSGTIKIDYFNEMLKEAWEEFESIYSERDPEYDPHILDSEAKDAYEDFFTRLFNNIYESNKNLVDINEDPLYTYDTERIIDNVLSKHNLSKPAIFSDCLSKHLNDPSDTVREFTDTIYRGLTNRYLIDREMDINFSDIVEGEEEIFLDTNVIVALLCESDKAHPVVRESIKIANELDFDIYYFNDTADELKKFINGSKREMNQFGGRPSSDDAIQSQFVQDWWRSTRDQNGPDSEYQSWSSYVAELSKWRKELKLIGIEEYDRDIDGDDAIEQFIDKSMTSVDRERPGKRRDPNNIGHDAKIVSKIYKIREQSSGSELYPMLVTLDSILTPVSDMGLSNFWDSHIAVQVRDWLNYATSFSSMAYSDNYRMGEIIIKTATRSAGGVELDNVEEFAELIAPKMGLDRAEAGAIVDYVTAVGQGRDREKYQ